MRLFAGCLFLSAAVLTTWGFAILLQVPEGLHPVRFQPWIDRFDLNGDREIDSLEYRQVAGGGPSFALLDMDGNGRIDVSELETAIRAVDPLWMYADPN